MTRKKSVRKTQDPLSRAIKISPSVLILVSSRSKKLTPSRSPFVHVTGNVCPFANCTPLVGDVTWKSGGRNVSEAMNVKKGMNTHSHALQGEERRQEGGDGGKRAAVGKP